MPTCARPPFEPRETAIPNSTHQECSIEIADEQWTTYDCVISEAEAAGSRFALGGAFALATHTGHLRNTKDMDLYVLPETRQEMVQVLRRCGLRDYFDQLPYDRAWIYRGTRDDAIVDIIWAMPNRRAVVDPMWLTAGPVVTLRGHSLRVIPVEELIWSKLYVMQRQRCDWPDVLNLLFHAAGTLEWRRLLDRLEADAPLLAGALALFAWLCPERADSVPGWVYDAAGVRQVAGPGCGARAHLLDTRPWFGPEFNSSPD